MTSTSLVEVDDLTDIRRLAARAAGSEGLRPVGLREVVSGPAALTVLPRVLERLGVAAGVTVALLSDDVAKARGDQQVLDVVAEVVAERSFAQRVILRGRGAEGVHADEATIEQAVGAVASLAPGALVTVGSGTIADIGKVVAERLDLTHVVVQTAASVNGFADDQSVLLRNGTKRTTPSRWPDALVIDSEVLASSPVAMTRSGLGDLLSTYTAAADWQLASVVGFDRSYAPTAVAVLRSGIDEAVASSGGLSTNQPGAVRGLARALTHGGLAMGLAGRTSPSSGAEHTISHLLEMKANAGHQAAAPHGAQVGAATVVVARIWATMRERLRAGQVTAGALDETELKARVARAFLPLDVTGAVAAECLAAYERKLTWINAHLPELRAVCADWERYDAALGDLLAGPEVVSGALQAAGAAASLAELDPAPTPDVARWAVANCHLMRDRFTIVDLAEVTGCWTGSDIDQAIQ